MFTARLILIYGSINKNQSLGEASYILNPIEKKNVATFLCPAVHASIGEIRKKNKNAA